jgi:DNA-binding IscR family transcriptional regulator
MLSQTAEHAIRAAACLARDPAASMTQQQVAAATGVPPIYLYKILQILGRAGLVQAFRGQRGGYRLARPPTAVTALDVVRAVSPMRTAGEGLEPVAAAIERGLTGITLAELAAQSAAPPALLSYPAPTASDDWAVWTARAG